ncbi:MAG: nucleotidyltransferase family protein [Wenzhouxiangellaceae bacterium]|nr:nucleotidyltransferase family protein [Wenzhouxiangellaceae bacterium]
MNGAARCNVIVLAGDRGPDDPLALDAGVAGKTLVPLHGRPMLDRVMHAVAGLDGVDRTLLVAPDRAEYADAVSAELEWRRVDPAAGPAASVERALAALASDQPVLLVTGDHPLVTAGWLEQFRSAALDSGADAVVGVVDHAAVMQRFPDSRRTRYRFADVAVCGTNLYWFGSQRGAAVAGLWRRFEADRKRPWRIVSRLGWWNLARYLAGRLTLAQAMAGLSRRLGLRLAAVFVDDAAAAVDVDSRADRDLVARILAERAGVERRTDPRTGR